MSEEEPVIHINEYEARRDNASLFMFYGELASRNHIFIQTEEEDGIASGAYCFPTDDATFNRMAGFMINNGYTAHINLHQVAECDERAYQGHIDNVIKSEETPDFIPDDWEK